MASTRRLAAILAADVAGYSRLMGADEEGTHERLKAHRRELVDPKIGEHRPHRQDDRRRAAGGIRERRRRGPLRRRGAARDDRPRGRNARGAPDQVPYRRSISATSSSRAATFRRRRQCRGAPGSAGRARRHLHLADGARPDPRQAALRFRGSGRAERQKYRSAGAGLCVAPRSRRRSAGIERAARPANLPARCRAAPVDRRAALYQSQQRPRAAIFRGRDHRGSDDRSVADRGHVRDLAQYRVHLSGQAGRHQAGRPRAWGCAMCWKAASAGRATRSASTPS